MDDGVDFGAAIAALRAQLLTALNDGDGSRVRFRASSIQVDFEVQVRREVNAQGGVRFWVVSGETSGTVDKTRVQRISLTLEPVDASGAVPTGLLIGDDAATRPE
ncbi:trypco2 family protein [Yinghuangia aomiensis]